MELLKVSNITSEMLTKPPSGIPLILCAETQRLNRKLSDAGYKEFSLNINLAGELMKISQAERKGRVEDILNHISLWKVPIILCDFEMLFDPRYELDVLKFICSKSRTVNMAVKWPGAYANGKLTYATPDDSDYHEFTCDSYQIRIVQ